MHPSPACKACRASSTSSRPVAAGSAADCCSCAAAGAFAAQAKRPPCRPWCSEPSSCCQVAGPESAADVALSWRCGVAVAVVVVVPELAPAGPCGHKELSQEVETERWIRSHAGCWEPVLAPATGLSRLHTCCNGGAVLPASGAERPGRLGGTQLLPEGRGRRGRSGGPSAALSDEGSAAQASTTCARACHCSSASPLVLPARWGAD